MFCHQVAGLSEGNALSAPTKMEVFVIITSEQTCLFESCANHSFDVVIKQTSRSRKITTVLDNIAKPTCYVLPPSGTTACGKRHVCTELNNAHVFLCD